MIDFGKEIEGLRRARGLSRSDLARLLSVTQQTVFNIERNPKYNITTDMMKRLEKALNIRFEITIVEEAMPSKMVIGSDELILHIRKHTSCQLTTDQLGAKIAEWMRNNGPGDPVDKDDPAYWDDTGRHIGTDKLPKTSAQWEILFTLLPDLYCFIRSI